MNRSYYMRCKMKILLLCLFYLLYSLSYSYVNVYPTYFDKKIDGVGETEEFVLLNTTDKERKYRVYLKEVEGKKSMNKWIEIYPKSVTLKPYEKSKVKIYVKSPFKEEKGEYYSILVFKELESITNKNKARESLKVMTELEMEIRGYVGKINPKLKLQEFKINKNNIKGLIENKGERRGRLEFFLLNSKDEEYFYLGKFNIEKDEQYKFDFQVDDTKQFNKFIIKEKEKILLEKELGRKK